MKHAIFSKLLIVGMGWFGPTLWAQEVKPIKPNSEMTWARDLQPFWASYKEVRNMGGEAKFAGYRVHQLQDVNFTNGPGWRSVINMVGMDTVTDEWRFLRSNFQPVVRIISARSMLHQIEVFGDKVAGVKIGAEGLEPQALDLKMKGQRFPGASLLFVIARMNIKKGDAFLFPAFSSDLGPENANIFEEVRVKGRETLKLANGLTFETWVLDRRVLDENREPLSLGGRPFPPYTTWMIDKPPYEIRTDRGVGYVELQEFVKTVPLKTSPE